MGKIEGCDDCEVQHLRGNGEFYFGEKLTYRKGLIKRNGSSVHLFDVSNGVVEYEFTVPSCHTWLSLVYLCSHFSSRYFPLLYRAESERRKFRQREVGTVNIMRSIPDLHESRVTRVVCQDEDENEELPESHFESRPQVGTCRTRTLRTCADGVKRDSILIASRHPTPCFPSGFVP